MGLQKSHPNYPAWRDRVSALHRKRHGAPDGFATVYGVHVPHKHSETLRFWASWIITNFGKQAALDFLEKEKSANWENMPRLSSLYARRLEVRRAREDIRKLQSEIYRVQNQNSR